MAAAVNGEGKTFEVGVVRPLFKIQPGGPGYFYDVSADGQKFLVNTLSPDSVEAPITVVVNWLALLGK